MPADPDAPFHLTLDPDAGGALRRAMIAAARPTIERLLAFPALNALYAGGWRRSAEAFPEAALERLRASSRAISRESPPPARWWWSPTTRSAASTGWRSTRCSAASAPTSACSATTSCTPSPSCATR
jgi:hypothetical protein